MHHFFQYSDFFFSPVPANYLRDALNSPALCSAVTLILEVNNCIAEDDAWVSVVSVKIEFSLLFQRWSWLLFQYGTVKILSFFTFLAISLVLINNGFSCNFFVSKSFLWSFSAKDILSRRFRIFIWEKIPLLARNYTHYSLSREGKAARKRR